MKIIIYTFLSFILLYLFHGCTFDNEEEYFKDVICDTTDVTYETVRRIFINNCATCHNVSRTFREGIELDNYESIKSSINTGLVLPAIKHTGPFQMPYQQPQLPFCYIRQIELWIQNGMPKTEADL